MLHSLSWMILLRPMPPSFDDVCALILKWLSASDIRRCRLVRRALISLYYMLTIKNSVVQRFAIHNRHGTAHGTTTAVHTSSRSRRNGERLTEVRFDGGGQVVLSEDTEEGLGNALT